MDKTLEINSSIENSFCKLNSPEKNKLSFVYQIPDNVAISLQNILNKRLSSDIKKKRKQNLLNYLNVVKCFFVFIILAITVKIISMFFSITKRVESKWNKSSHKTIKICFYLIFSFALIIQFIQFYAVIYNRLCLTFVFTCVEFVFIFLIILDDQNLAKHGSWMLLIFLIGLLIFVLHLIILHKIKNTNESSLSQSLSKIDQKDINIENESLNFADTKTYHEFYKKFIQLDNDELENNLESNYKFINDEEEVHLKREKLCKEMLKICQMKIKDLELNQSKNQHKLDLQEQNQDNLEEITSNLQDGFHNCNKQNQIQTCDDRNCKEATKEILNIMKDTNYCLDS